MRIGLRFIPVIVAGILCCLLHGFVHQKYGVRVARSHAMIVTPQLRADPRFNFIQCGGGGTEEEGCFWVVGIVPSEQDFAALQHLIDSSHPPVRTLYQVKVEASASR